MISEANTSPVYMDCNATTPLDPRVRDLVYRYLTEEFGNAGSRTHEYGSRAKQAVQKAREQVAAVVGAESHEIVFTSGATESNNLAILGLMRHGEKTGKKHVVGTLIEHKAVLEPLEELERQGFEVTLLKPTGGGWIDPESVKRNLRPDTLLVTVMHVNNETGVVQPIEEIAEVVLDSDAFLHTDAAQGFGKDFVPLNNQRLDLISISGHKIYAPKGVGALVMRKRGYKRPPLTPLMFGGGHERGVRPGTLPVHLIAGLGLAAELAYSESNARNEKCKSMKQRVLDTFLSLGAIPNGDQDRVLSHVVNLSLPGVSSEALMVSLRDVVAISNGSACTSHRYEPSHVLKAMELDDDKVLGALRISWCYMTEEPDMELLISKIKTLL